MELEDATMARIIVGSRLDLVAVSAASREKLVTPEARDKALAQEFFDATCSTC